MKEISFFLAFHQLKRLFLINSEVSDQHVESIFVIFFLYRACFFFFNQDYTLHFYSFFAY